MFLTIIISFFFFFNDTATTEIYTLSLHDALPIFRAISAGTNIRELSRRLNELEREVQRLKRENVDLSAAERSEEHTSELQSLTNLVCRLLLEKKKKSLRHHDTPRKYTRKTTQRQN